MPERYMAVLAIDPDPTIIGASVRERIGHAVDVGGERLDVRLAL